MLVELTQQSKAEEKDEEGLQLSNTTEFCRSVLTPMEKAQEARGGGAFLGPKPSKGIKVTNSTPTKSAKPPPSPTESQPREDAEEGELVEEQSKEDDDSDSEPEFMAEQPIGNSVAGALAYLQSKDFFSLDKIRRRRGHHLELPLHNAENEKEVNLDYRDSFGNVMNAKDAFRRISWHFHGKFPSLKKQEKQLKRIELERRLQENLMESLPTLKALQRVQEGDGTAHLVLTGGNIES
ncbi:hypothetical protein cyc_04784 [Cyclospora cayetanensis]|nr:hypothetical protein cyc_04784 [Cyclospora cayetanensis]